MADWSLDEFRQKLDVLGRRIHQCPLPKDMDERAIGIEVTKRIMRAPPFTWHDANLEVKTTTEKGDGVFTKTFIPKRSIATFYPQHWVMIGDDVVYPKDTIPPSDDVCRIYSVRMTDGVLSIGDPRKRECQALLGHLVNDASLNPQAWIAEPHNVCKVTIKYMLYVKANRNMMACGFDGGMFAYVTTRDVMPGEELLIDYGVSYWIDHEYMVRRVGVRGETMSQTELYKALLDIDLERVDERERTLFYKLTREQETLRNDIFL